jgi:uncharacterized LabA/DUF88 family protein
VPLRWRYTFCIPLVASAASLQSRLNGRLWSFYVQVLMETNLYVDGFNLYYGLDRVRKAYPGSSYKWLDLAGLATTVWPMLRPLKRIRYFTALVQAMPGDPQAPLRQQIYLRALRTRNVEVHFGLFKKRTQEFQLRGAIPQQPTTVDRIVLRADAHITKYDEKGSDVNLASFLIRDAAVGDCDNAIVISNDSDLAEAVRIAQRDFSVRVYVISPADRGVKEMRAVAAGLRALKPATVLANQLPVTMSDQVGTLTKPATW